MFVIFACAVYVRQIFQPFFRTETIICFAFFYKFQSIFHIFVFTLALNVWAIVTTHDWAFVIIHANCFESVKNDVNCTLNVSFHISIFNSQNKLAVVFACKQICIQCSAQVANVHIACWAWCKTSANFFYHKSLHKVYLFCQSASTSSFLPMPVVPKIFSYS